MSKSNEIPHFFQAPIFKQLAKELWRRYYLKGDFGVSIGLKSFGKVETDPLRSLLGITELAWSKKKSIQISSISEALETSAVAWSTTDFVSKMLDQPLNLKSVVEEQEKQAFQCFSAELNQIDPIFVKLLTEKQLREWSHQDTQVLADFRKVATALKNLPKEYTRIPVFAYQQTGDTHAFDQERLAGRLLIQILTELSVNKQSGETFSIVEEKNSLLNEFYLLRDDSLNFVAIRGLVAKKNEKINEMWRQACLESCSWNVPLKEILRMDQIYPADGKKVLIVENSGIYSLLVDLFPHLPIICSSGQFTNAVWQLLRKLVASNTQLYYSGDLDPEGLVMAQRLQEAFPEQVDTFVMDLASYHTVSTYLEVGDNRLKQLRLIKDPSLKLVANQILETKQVTYQEGLLEVLIDKVKNVFGE